MITTLQKMAKKINFKTIDEVVRASNALKDLHVEHVLVKYPQHMENNRTRAEKQYIVVRNTVLPDAKTAFEAANLTPSKIKNSRHYETTALNHNFYQPEFDCKCRNCGKTFKSVVKGAVWCSKDCKKAYRNEKRKNKVV